MFNALIPLAVTTALTIELYLKCLLRLDKGGWPGEHNHRRLFEALGPSRQKEIRDWHAAYMASDPTQLQLQSLEKASFNAMEFDFDSQLDVGADVFVTWRYWFENPSIRNQGLVGYPSTVARAVRTAILNSQPAWANHLTPLRD